MPPIADQGASATHKGESAAPSVPVPVATPSPPEPEVVTSDGTHKHVPVPESEQEIVPVPQSEQERSVEVKEEPLSPNQDVAQDVDVDALNAIKVNWQTMLAVKHEPAEDPGRSLFFYFFF